MNSRLTAKKLRQLQKALGKKVRENRLRHRLSKSKAAKSAGVSQTWITALEKGESNPSILKFLAVAKALRVSPEQLLRGIR